MLCCAVLCCAVLCPAGCKAHLGFLLQFLGITSASDPARNLGIALRELSGGRQPDRVICVGHSLGGALATLGKTA